MFLKSTMVVPFSVQGPTVAAGTGFEQMLAKSLPKSVELLPPMNGRGWDIILHDTETGFRLRLGDAPGAGGGLPGAANRAVDQLKHLRALRDEAETMNMERNGWLYEQERARLRRSTATLLSGLGEERAAAFMEALG